MNTLTENFKLLDEMAISGHSIADIRAVTGLGHNLIVNARKNRPISIESAIKISAAYSKEVEDLFDFLVHKRRHLDLTLSKDLKLVRAIVKHNQ